MKVALKVGAELDVLTPAEMRAMMDDLQRQVGRLERRMTEGPLVRRVVAAGDVDSNNIAVIRFDRPPTGWSYDVRRITVCGPNPEVTYAGQVYVYTGSAGGGISTDTPSPYDLVAATMGGTVIPNSIEFSRHELVATAEQTAYVRGVGLVTVGMAKLYAVGTVILEPLAAQSRGVA